MSVKYWVIIFCAGGLGALSRLGLSALINMGAGGRFPWGTMLVNLSGCFFFGLVWALSGRQFWPEQVRLVLLAGFLGAFTTFSSLIFDTFILWEIRPLPAAANLAAQLAGGVILLFLGMRAARFFG